MISNIFGNSSITNRNDIIYLDDYSSLDLLKTISIPSFIFLKRRIEHNIKLFQDCLSTCFKSFRFFYSVKSNYVDEVIKTIDGLQIPFEIVSELELDFLIECSAKITTILVGGPYLSEKLIERTLMLKNPIFVVYNVHDLIKINSIALQQNISGVEILLRFQAPKINSHLGFSSNPEKVLVLSNQISSLTNIKIVGILSHYGTQLNSIDVFQQNVDNCINIMHSLENNGIKTLKILDLGGGFPIASQFDKKHLTQIFSLIRNTLAEAGYGEMMIFFEPGRFIVGDAGVCVAKIIETDSETNSFFLNVGNNILPKFAKNPLRFYDLNKSLLNYNQPVNIYGAVPSDEDILAVNYNFSKNFTIGDHILITNCGAYALTFSNRFPYKSPGLYMIDGEKLYHANFDF